MKNKYGFPESWTTQIQESNEEVTLTLDKQQLHCLLNQINSSCVNELVNPVYKETFKAIWTALYPQN